MADPELDQLLLRYCRQVIMQTMDRVRSSRCEQTDLLNAIREEDGRVNLSWGSNTIIHVLAGYADVAVKFARGFSHAYSE